jgi:RNA polymerase II elongation factor ELL
VKHTSKESGSHSISSNKKPKTSADRPIRERIVHLLALKPYSKAELMLRLNKDGLSEKDKDSIDHVLSQIGSINPKTNSYELSNSVILNEVKDDWFFYSDGEKQLAKRYFLKVLICTWRLRTGFLKIH